MGKGKNVVILGSTGSIGRQALEVIETLGEDWRVIAVTADHNFDLLNSQIQQFGCRYAALNNRTDAARLRSIAPEWCQVLEGPEAMKELAALPEADIILVAVLGTAGIEPTLAALKAGKRVALANKETLVAAGALIMQALQQEAGMLVPVDSEHSAIFQCLAGQEQDALESITLTASGGAFRDYPLAELAHVTPEMALRHPNWNMGPKITIDSATLMNKGLEVIEAHWLFAVDYDQINVAIHPGSMVHSMVHLRDGSILAQLGAPDMRLPIQYAFTYPKRLPNNYRRLNLFECGPLLFERPDLQRFPALKLAYDAGKAGGTAPAVLNAANEEAVAAFRAGRIGFMDITRIVAETLGKHINSNAIPDLGTILEADAAARVSANSIVRQLEGK
ncbi:MAG: 1-deoxy-D-xylulose-5-phosphate reductoisomerase [Bacillota bacterium]|jgi:1-deoxy-D-xylulose-5-phosphate reductoisomerase